MQHNELSIDTMQSVEEIVKANKEIIALKQQKFGIEQNIKNLTQKIKDLENKKIKQLMAPMVSFGNSTIYEFHRCETDAEFFRNTINNLKNSITQSENGLKSIEGQLDHRMQTFNEIVMKVTRTFISHLSTYHLEVLGLERPKTEGESLDG